MVDIFFLCGVYEGQISGLEKMAFDDANNQYGGSSGNLPLKVAFFYATRDESYEKDRIVKLLTDIIQCFGNTYIDNEISMPEEVTMTILHGIRDSFYLMATEIQVSSTPKKLFDCSINAVKAFVAENSGVRLYVNSSQNGVEVYATQDPSGPLDPLGVLCG